MEYRQKPDMLPCDNSLINDAFELHPHDFASKA